MSTKEFKIVRGIKPNIFEIYQDKVLLNQDAAVRDYQDYLERFILKLNYKSFTQIVILGSALERAQVYEILNRIGAMSVEQIQEEEDLIR